MKVIDRQDAIDTWWGEIRSNRSNLEKLIVNFHPFFGRPIASQFTISAPGAQRICDIENAAVAANNIDPLKVLARGLDNPSEENGLKIVDILNEVWFGVPESMESRSIPGFFMMCDLISDHPFACGDYDNE